LRLDLVGARLHALRTAGEHRPHHAPGQGVGHGFGRLLHALLEAVAEIGLLPDPATEGTVHVLVGVAAQPGHLARLALAATEDLHRGTERIEGDVHHFAGQPGHGGHQLPGAPFQLAQALGVGGAHRHRLPVDVELAIVEEDLRRHLARLAQPDPAAVHQHVVGRAHPALARGQGRNGVLVIGVGGRGHGHGQAQQ